ncbi:unnamed protein product [Withania somnifera]
MSRSRNSVHSTQIVKFLYSYGGRIFPRRSDGTLRYVGGFTRVLSVDRSSSLSELMVKFGELCRSSVTLRCKLPTEDLDVLVSITCDQDLANVMEEYDRVSTLTNQEMKIRAILSPMNLPKKISLSSSPMSCFDFPVSYLKPEKLGYFNSAPSMRRMAKSFYYRYCGHGSIKPLYYYSVPHHYQ